MKIHYRTEGNIVIKIHDTAKVSPKSDIEDSSRGSLIEIGANSTIDSFVKFKPAGGTGDIKIGNRVYINSCCVLYSGNGISIGDDVLISANCTLAPVNHEYKNKLKKISTQGHAKSKGGVTIEENVWIGSNTVILDGSYICSGTIIAAGSVVRGKCESNRIFGGNPLREIKKI